MNFLEKLDFLIKKNNLNKKRLAEKSGIPYSTIDAFYKKGYNNIKLSNFKKLCEFFGVTMDYMGYDNISEIEYYSEINKNLNLTKHEEDIILHYRKSDSLDKELVHRSLKIKE
jgi:Helix-turn-helix.